MLGHKGLRRGSGLGLLLVGGAGNEDKGISLCVKYKLIWCFLLVYFDGVVVILVAHVTGGKQSQLLVLGLGTGVWQQWIMIFLGLHWNFIWWVLFRGIGGSEAMCWQTWRWWFGVWGLWQNADTAVTREESCERVGVWSKLREYVIYSQPLTYIIFREIFCNEYWPESL